MRVPEMISRPGVRLCRDARVDAGLCEAVADVVATGKQTIEGLFPGRTKEEIRVHALAATSWHENIATNRRETIYLRVNERGFGSAMRADAGPLGMLCQAVAELYNDRRIMGFDRLMAARPHEIQVGILKRLRGAPMAAWDDDWGMSQEGYLGTPSKSTEEYGRLHLEEGARLTAELALKLITGKELPELNDKMKSVLNKHVTLD